MKKLLLLPAAFALAALGALPASAQGLKPPAGWSLQAGISEHDTGSLSASVVWPWEWRSQIAGLPLEGYTEAYASWWSAHAVGGGRQGLAQIGLLPVVRMRFDGGRSTGTPRRALGSAC